MSDTPSPPSGRAPSPGPATTGAGPSSAEPSNAAQQKLQAVFWRLLSCTFGQGERAQNIEQLTKQLAKELSLPELLLDPMVSISTLVQRFPELKPDFEAPMPGAVLDESADGEVAIAASATAAAPAAAAGDAAPPSADERVRRALVFSKLLLNAFGPATMTKSVTAGQYAQWMQDLGCLEQSFGYAPGGLRGRGGGSGSGGGVSGRNGASDGATVACRAGWLLDVAISSATVALGMGTVRAESRVVRTVARGRMCAPRSIAATPGRDGGNGMV